MLNALYRDPGEDSGTPRLRPKPLHKHIRVSLLRDQAGTSLPSYDEIFGWMADEVIERSQGSKTVVSLMDGQDSLWKRREHSLPDTEVVDILDLLHALSYLWRAAHLLYAKGSTEADDFVYERAYRILCGEVQSVIRGLRRMGSLRNCVGKSGKSFRESAGILKTTSTECAMLTILPQAIRLPRVSLRAPAGMSLRIAWSGVVCDGYSKAPTLCWVCARSIYVDYGINSWISIFERNQNACTRVN